MEHRPIFLGGLSFTGKTQLRLMLSAHPNILISRRTHLWDRFYQRFGDLSQANNLERCLKEMLAFEPIRALHPDEGRIRAEFARGAATYEHLFACLHAQHAHSQGKPRWGDQLGFIERYAERLFAAYPSARMIHMLRDPGARSAESRSTSRRGLGRIGWETAWWLTSARLAERHQQLYPARYLVVRYEELFARTEPTLRRICDFLGERFEPQMLIHGEIEAHADGIGQSLPRHDLRFIRAHAARPMQSFGYDSRGLRLSGREWMLYGLALPFNLAALLAARLGQRELIRKESSA